MTMKLVPGWRVEVGRLAWFCVKCGGGLTTCLSVSFPGLPLYMKSLRWALVVMAVFLAVCTVAIVALASRGGMVSRPYPVSL